MIRHVLHLASGGMARVDLEQWRIGDRWELVAVKTAHPWCSSARLAAEASVQIDSPFVVQTYGLDGDRLVMEYVDGVSLHELLRDAKRVPPEITDAIIRDVGAGLRELHRREIVHRDVSPSNVLVGVDGGARIADLGCAKIGPESPDGKAYGKVDYMSPEQARGEPVTGASDTWSLLCVRHLMLTGRHPFRGATDAETLGNIATRDVVDVARDPAARRVEDIGEYIAGASVVAGFIADHCADRIERRRSAIRGGIAHATAST